MIYLYHCLKIEYKKWTDTVKFRKKEEETESLFRVSNSDSICWTLGAMHSRDIKGVPGECIEMLLSVSNQTLLGRRAIAEY